MKARLNLHWLEDSIASVDLREGTDASSRLRPPLCKQPVQMGETDAADGCQEHDGKSDNSVTPLLPRICSRTTVEGHGSKPHTLAARRPRKFARRDACWRQHDSQNVVERRAVGRVPNPRDFSDLQRIVLQVGQLHQPVVAFYPQPYWAILA